MSDTRRPQCVPLCGAVRAYGKEKAERPESWWLHENGCPMREWLRFAMETEVVLPDLDDKAAVNSFASWFVAWQREQGSLSQVVFTSGNEPGKDE